MKYGTAKPAIRRRSGCELPGCTCPAAALEIKFVAVNDPVIVMLIVVTLVLKIVLVAGIYLVTCVVLVRGVEV